MSDELNGLMGDRKNRARQLQPCDQIIGPGPSFDVEDACGGSVALVGPKFPGDFQSDIVLGHHEREGSVEQFRLMSLQPEQCRDEKSRGRCSAAFLQIWANNRLDLRKQIGSPLIRPNDGWT